VKDPKAGSLQTYMEEGGATKDYDAGNEALHNPEA
jgi:hypothetical protein